MSFGQWAHRGARGRASEGRATPCKGPVQMGAAETRSRQTASASGTCVWRELEAGWGDEEGRGAVRRLHTVCRASGRSLPKIVFEISEEVCGVG